MASSTKKIGIQLVITYAVSPLCEMMYEVVGYPPGVWTGRAPLFLNASFKRCILPHF